MSIQINDSIFMRCIPETENVQNQLAEEFKEILGSRENVLSITTEQLRQEEIIDEEEKSEGVVLKDYTFQAIEEPEQIISDESSDMGCRIDLINGQPVITYIHTSASHYLAANPVDNNRSENDQSARASGTHGSVLKRFRNEEEQANKRPGKRLAPDREKRPARQVEQKKQEQQPLEGDQQSTGLNTGVNQQAGGDIGIPASLQQQNRSGDDHHQKDGGFRFS